MIEAQTATAASKRWLSEAATRRLLEVTAPVLDELARGGAIAYRRIPGHRGRQFDRQSVEVYAEACIVRGPEAAPQS